MRCWNDSGLAPVPAARSWAHASDDGTILADGDGEAPRRAVRETRNIWPARLKNLPEKPATKRPRDQVSPVGAVMLHLRARYVSKAAILTVPASLMPVENRSPA
jgi:hypothetical protein